MAALKRIPRYALASVAVSLGGLLNGYDTGSIGAVTAMPQFTQSVGVLSSSLLGFTVSLIMLTGALPSVVAGHLADKHGRLHVIEAGTALLLAGVVLQGSAQGLPQFLVGRALSGLGQGTFLSNISVYICEIAPARHRGTLAGLPQFMATAGVCVGYFTCYGTIEFSSSMAWRTPYIAQGALAVVLGLSCFVLPESPRWLMLHGRTELALRSLQRLGLSNESERDFLNPAEQRPSLTGWQSFLMLFRKAYRTRTMLALFVLGMVQLSGIDGVLYVSDQ
jgi:MFS family permease